MHTDTITIIHKSKVEKLVESDEEANPSEEMIKNIGLKKLKTDIFKRESAVAKEKQKYTVDSDE